MSDSETRRVLFVCLGNICRSPIAEAVFINLVKQREISHRWEVDSAGLGGWHTGSRPDSRARAVMATYNLTYDNLARQITSEDYHYYDYIFGMDNNNISGLMGDAPENCRAQIKLLGDYDPSGNKIIRDPYYDSGSEGFEEVYKQCQRACLAFLDSLQ